MLRLFVGLAMLASLAMTAAPATAATAPAAATHAQLVQLFAEWRAFNHPQMVRGKPDYSARAMAAKAARLPEFRARLAAIGTDGWSASQRGDHRLIEAEMNGLDFFLRVLKPWARDPGFYQTVFPDMSDVPAHEGTFAEPNIDLYEYKYPLSRADDAKLAELLGAVPGLLADARVNLSPSRAHDLWAYGDRSLIEQAEALAQLEAGTLSVRDLGGRHTASLQGASSDLRAAVRNARLATEKFARWIKAEAPKRKGSSGLGKADYNWYLKNVLLSPYDFDQQATLLQRELDRSLASLRLEEVRNRGVPPIAETGESAYARFSEARTDKHYRLLVDAGFIADKPYYRSAFAAQTPGY